MTAWYDDDAFWTATAPFVFNDQRLAGAKTDVEHLITLAGLFAGMSVLDLGCGIGRHSLELARSGCRVTGVDRNKSYLAAAADAAERAGLLIEWVQADMRQFRRPAAFDFAVNLLTSFGYFEDPAADRQVVENVFASLKPGGRFALDIMSKEVLARIFRERDWQESPDGAILLEERKVRDGWRWLDLRWIIVSGRQRTENRFSLRLYSAVELSEMLESAGFSDVRAYGSLQGGPYDHTAQRLVLLVTRPG